MIPEARPRDVAYGSQFVCDGGGHFGMPMVTLKPRPEYQKQLEIACKDALAKARGDSMRKKRRRS